VIAANNDGVWNESGASIAFVIPPAFYQTRWFYALCALAGVAMLAALYRMRVRQVAAPCRDRLEARLAERERIARDLHDTLLQGVQGLIWRFQAAADRIPADQPARHLLEQSLDRADKLLEESRDKVKGSARLGARCCPSRRKPSRQSARNWRSCIRPNSHVSVQGARRDLHPIVREEGFFIGREALDQCISTRGSYEHRSRAVLRRCGAAHPSARRWRRHRYGGAGCRREAGSLRPARPCASGPGNSALPSTSEQAWRRH
jgi:hypothetical protein